MRTTTIRLHVNCSLMAVILIGCNDRMSFQLNSDTQLQSNLTQLQGTTHIDLGRLRYGSKVHYDFVLINAGANPIAITGGKTSCSCVVLDIPDIPTTVPPNGQLCVPVAFDIVSADEEYSASVVLQLVQHTKKETIHDKLELTAEATVEFDYTVTPPALDVEVSSNNPVQEASFLLVSSLPIAIHSLSSTKAFIRASEPTGDPGRQQFNVSVEYDPKLQNSEQRGFVIVETNSKSTPSLEIPVRALFLERARLNRSSIVIPAKEIAIIRQSIIVESQARHSLLLPDSYPGVVEVSPVRDNGTNTEFLATVYPSESFVDITLPIKVEFVDSGEVVQLPLRVFRFPSGEKR